MAPSSNSSWVAKAPRMRTACTQCHAAKIRCSGEKTGCQRCTTLSLHCEYVVSMVGRTPKRQRKTSEARSNGQQTSSLEARPPEASLATPPYPSSHASVSETPTTTANPSRDGSLDISQTIFAAGQTLPQPDFNDQNLFDCLNDDSWVTGGAACTTGLDDGTGFGEATGFEIESFPLPSDLQVLGATSGPSFLKMGLSQPPSLSSAIPGFFPMSPRSPGQSVTGLPSTQTNQDWGQHAHVVALCKMIRLLENHVQAKSTPVDEVMKLSQACIRDITKISSKKEYMQCRSCPALISTIMELIVTLYEDTTRNQVQEPESTASPGLSKPSGPLLHFGVFELDPEEQTAIRNRIIRKEAQECVQIIQVLKRLLGGETPTAGRETLQSRALAEWCEGMEKRMNELISSLLPLP
ncbi:Fungal zn(2)-Cys(6) binuclear cluster domain-containing protein [Madurella fahalii]|uniref:Fungal zn(2)-Cys(6) binuclear cluster domain-containing protein n=1 Tax=Madurella fahalii TaxID=1157608 RepID=A0ABQ0GI28_9PEZI